MTEVRIRPLDDPHAQLAGLSRKNLNFDPSTFARGELGWNDDEYRQELPPESPGSPEQGGSWDTARAICAKYGFVDDSIVRAIFDPDEPLEDRNMLLEVHFWRLLIYAPVRGGEVFDGARNQDGRDVQVWGWNYRTLEGHFEMGQIDYEVWKWLDSGRVEFCIHVTSRAAPIRDPILRLGFAVFGRKKQVQFAQRACRRMGQLVTDAVGRGTGE